MRKSPLNSLSEINEKLINEYDFEKMYSLIYDFRGLIKYLGKKIGIAQCIEKYQEPISEFMKIGSDIFDKNFGQHIWSKKDEFLRYANKSYNCEKHMVLASLRAVEKTRKAISEIDGKYGEEH